jgi:hypothetical protein
MHHHTNFLTTSLDQGEGANNWLAHISRSAMTGYRCYGWGKTKEKRKIGQYQQLRYGVLPGTMNNNKFMVMTMILSQE